MKKCDKISFETEENARDELIRINETIHKPWKDKKPHRYYKCEFCGTYHLTSQPKIFIYDRKRDT